MAHKKATLFDRIFKDRDGKLVIWQSPNILLWGWILFSILGITFKHGAGHTSLNHLATASLFVWAYLEIRSGASIFRQILGGVVMTGIVYGFFRP